MTLLSYTLPCSPIDAQPEIGLELVVAGTGREHDEAVEETEISLALKDESLGAVSTGVTRDCGEGTGQTTDRQKDRVVRINESLSQEKIKTVMPDQRRQEYFDSLPH